MKLLHKKIKEMSVVLLALFAASAVSSCAGEKDLPSGSDAGNGTVRVAATIFQTQDTRADEGQYPYQDYGPIINGHYYMTYPNKSDNNTYSVCDVNFYDGHGVTTTNSGYELKWQEVGALTYDDTQTVFWLDNVPRLESDPNATLIPFTADYNPFVAGVFDDKYGTNDLLWGYAHIPVETKGEFYIGIHHYMSRVSVIVTVDNSNDNAEKVDFSKGSVMISNLVHEGVSYNRTTGSIDLGPNPAYKNLYLTQNGDWGEVSNDPQAKGITYFQTKNFVLPPQTLRTDDLRPRLVLDVPQSDGSIRRYSGVLPRIMLVNGTPANLAFDPEKNLTLKVTLSQDLLYIVSIYAYVQDWVDKGTHIVTGNQAGIYSESDLANMITAYNENNEDELIHYGTKFNGEWVFDIFGNLEIEETAFAGSMANGPEFKFDLTSHTLTIIKSDGKEVTFEAEEEEEAAQALYNLLRNGTL